MRTSSRVGTTLLRNTIAGQIGWLTLLLMATGCRERAPATFGVIFSGDTAGWITPCGCASNQSGGLARRGTLIDQNRNERPTLFVDVGGSSSGTTDYHQVKLESILRGMMRMDLRAHNVGKPETDLGPAVLRRLADATDAPWLSTNLVPRAGDWIPERLIIEQIGGCRVGIAGVMDPDMIDSDAWTARDPVSAVIDAFDQSETDVRIVLAYMDQQKLQSLAAALPEVHGVLGGPTGQSMSPKQIGDVTVMSATNKGKYVGKLVFRGSADASNYRATDANVIEVSSDLKEDDRQLDNLKHYYERLSTIDFSADQTGLVSGLASGRDGYEIAGSQRCAACHAADDSLWHRSRHAHAWEVLVSKGAQFDPSCQQCHTTGYGLEGGFRNVAVSGQQVHVGCENCHGPSRQHVDNPKIKTPWVAARQCVRCHDRENSPHFQYDAYWAKIIHGVDPIRSGDASNASEANL